MNEVAMLLCGTFAVLFLILLGIDVGRKIKAHRVK